MRTNVVLGRRRCWPLVGAFFISFAVVPTSTAEPDRPAPPKAEGPAAGLVLTLRGKWILEGDPERQITGGEQLAPGARIRPEKAGPGVFIRVFLYGAGDAHRYEGPSRLPGNAQPKKLRWLSAIMGRNRSALVAAGARDGSLLTRAVLKLDSGQIDFSAALKDLPQGKWKLHMVRQSMKKPPAGGAPPNEVILSIDWKEGRPGVISTESVSPGVYLVQPLGQPGNQPVLGPTLVLVATPEKFRETRDAYAEAVELTQTWDESARVDAADVRFLEIVLQTLAEE